MPPGNPWNNEQIELFNNRLRKECLNRNHWTSLLEARVVIEEFKDDHNHRHSSLSYLTPAECAVRCTHTDHPRGRLRDQLTSHTYGSRTKWSDYRGPARVFNRRPQV